MDPNICAAIIGAVAVIVAAVISRSQSLTSEQVQFLGLWVMANVVAIIIWWTIINNAGNLGLDFSQANFLGGIVSGVVAGVLQWVALKNWVPYTWISIVALGWGIGGGIISFSTLDPFINNLLAGLITGLLGWFILSRYFTYAGLWILAVVIDWVLSHLAGGYLGWSFDPLSGAIVGLAGSFVTGLIFIFALKEREQTSA